MKNKPTLKKHNLLFVLPLAAMLFTACQHGKNNNNSKPANIEVDADSKLIDTDKFRVAVPKAWRKDIKEMSGFRILFFYAPMDAGSTPNINFLTEDMHGATADQYIAASKQKVQSGGIVVGESGNFSGNGVSGMYSLNTMNYAGTELAEKLYIFTKDNTAYVITGTCLLNQKDKYQPMFDKIVKTFTIK
jgi:hypothetical protein